MSPWLLFHERLPGGYQTVQRKPLERRLSPSGRVRLAASNEVRTQNYKKKIFSEILVVKTGSFVVNVLQIVYSINNVVVSTQWILLIKCTILHEHTYCVTVFMSVFQMSVFEHLCSWMGLLPRFEYKSVFFRGLSSSFFFFVIDSSEIELKSVNHWYMLMYFSTVHLIHIGASLSVCTFT